MLGDNICGSQRLCDSCGGKKWPGRRFDHHISLHIIRRRLVGRASGTALSICLGWTPLALHISSGGGELEWRSRHCITGRHVINFVCHFEICKYINNAICVADRTSVYRSMFGYSRFRFTGCLSSFIRQNSHNFSSFPSETVHLSIKHQHRGTFFV